MLRDKEKERVENFGLQDNEDGGDMEVNYEGQNIEENIAVTEIDIDLRWDLNYEPTTDRRLSLFLSNFLYPRSLSPPCPCLYFSVSLSVSVCLPVCLSFSISSLSRNQFQTSILFNYEQ